ncbi:MAG: 6-phosphogluconolactonase, partial [Muribaculaceae bacterium]|nr:6-phosphogluconolactonase [Muribaculaceae bacterium]
MGKKAAADVSAAIKKALEEKDEISIIFAAAPSQNEFLQSLTSDPTIDWTRINAYHMDEYIGLDADAPQGFGNFLRERIFDKVPFRSVNLIPNKPSNNDEAIESYTEKLKQTGVDITCMGIGENGHIAFNDPHVADFNDPNMMKIVELDNKCRQQQVNDGCFKKLEDVPTHAFTLTIPTLMSAKDIFCMVPAAT